jgi:hypothetical protein
MNVQLAVAIGVWVGLLGSMTAAIVVSMCPSLRPWLGERAKLPTARVVTPRPWWRRWGRGWR